MDGKWTDVIGQLIEISNNLDGFLCSLVNHRQLTKFVAKLSITKLSHKVLHCLYVNLLYHNNNN